MNCEAWMDTSLLNFRIHGFNCKSESEIDRFKVVPKFYPDGDVEFELDISGSNLDSIEQMVETIYLFNRYSDEDNSSNGNSDIILNFFGIPYANTFADKCMACHSFGNKVECPAHFIVKRNFSIKTVANNISQCSVKKCRFMHLDGPQMMSLIDKIKEAFRMK